MCHTGWKGYWASQREGFQLSSAVPPSPSPPSSSVRKPNISFPESDLLIGNYEASCIYCMMEHSILVSKRAHILCLRWDIFRQNPGDLIKDTWDTLDAWKKEIQMQMY